MTTRNYADSHPSRFGMMRHLQQELILGDSLHGLDQIRRDGVGQSVPLLNFLHRQEESCDQMKLTKTLQSHSNSHRWYPHQSSSQHALGWAEWSLVCSYSSSHTSGTCQPGQREKDDTVNESLMWDSFAWFLKRLGFTYLNVHWNGTRYKIFIAHTHS